MRVAIVFNRGSGQRAANGALRAVLAALAPHRYTLDVIDTRTRPDFERYIHDTAGPLDRVIAIGGDGTLNGVINGVLRSERASLPVAFVPTGRGKDAARSVGGWRPDAFVDGAFEGAECSHIDVIRITMVDGTVRYGVNVSDLGLAAHAARVANRAPRMLGSLSYVVGAARAIVPPKPFPLRFTLDGTDFDVADALLLSVCNGRSFGGGIHIAPDASCRDGVLDIVVAHHANLLDLGLQLPKLKKGIPFDHPALMRWRGRVVTVPPGISPWYEVDGEPLRWHPVRYEVVPQALMWLNP